MNTDRTEIEIKSENILIKSPQATATYNCFLSVKSTHEETQENTPIKSFLNKLE